MEKPDLQAALDQRLEAALSSAHYRVTLNLKKQNVKLKLQNKLIFAINGGVFKIDQALIAFVGALRSAGQTEALLLDKNENPVQITKLQEFFEKIIDIYYEAMNEFMTETKTLARQRSPSALVEG